MDSCETNRDHVVRDLRYLKSYGKVSNNQTIYEIADSALELLKDQEAVKPKSKVRHGANAQIQHFCGNCNTMLHGKPKFCSECGKAVKWG